MQNAEFRIKIEIKDQKIGRSKDQRPADEVGFGLFNL